MEEKDIATRAEEVIQSLIHEDKKGKKVIDVTTNQIRKFLTAVNNLTNKIEVYQVQNGQKKELSTDLMNEVKYLKVKLIYQIARNKTYRSDPVGTFVERADLLNEIDKVGNSVERYKKFNKYVEALVAYHKYYGGRD